MSAVISECGKYRYVLHRSLGSIVRCYKPILFVMLNPSIADATIDDATIRRCMGFAKREHRTHLTVVNLFALRATNPVELRQSPDPYGPLNSSYLHDEVTKHKGSPIVCAWGSNMWAKPAASTFVNTFSSADLFCLGKTKDGSPRHPLYLPKNAKVVTL